MGCGVSKSHGVREPLTHPRPAPVNQVLEATFEESRLVKERAAVLSEMSMVNTIEYRVECAILQVLVNTYPELVLLLHFQGYQFVPSLHHPSQSLSPVRAKLLEPTLPLCSFMLHWLGLMRLLLCCSAMSSPAPIWAALDRACPACPAPALPPRQALHAENMLSTRFPIGLKHLIESWTLAEVKAYHDTHYYPGNALLYLVGDLDPDQMFAQMTQVGERVCVWGGGD